MYAFQAHDGSGLKGIWFQIVNNLSLNWWFQIYLSKDKLSNSHHHPHLVPVDELTPLVTREVARVTHHGTGAVLSLAAVDGGG